MPLNLVLSAAVPRHSRLWFMASESRKTFPDPSISAQHIQWCYFPCTSEASWRASHIWVMNIFIHDSSQNANMNRIKFAVFFLFIPLDYHSTTHDRRWDPSEVQSDKDSARHLIASWISSDGSRVVSVMNCPLNGSLITPQINLVWARKHSWEARKARRKKKRKVFRSSTSSKCVMKWNFTINQKFVLLFNCFVLFNAVALINCDVFKLGYLTGSARRPGDLEYERPGEWIN